MDIRLNNLQNPSNMVCLTDVPNILKVEDTSGGTYTAMSFMFFSGLKNVTSKDGQWFITLLGETITNVTDPKMAVGKNFYIASTASSTAASVARALRCLPTIAANFNVTVSNGTVLVKAKSIGPIDSPSIASNISSQYLLYAGTVGIADSELYGAKVVVDITTMGAGGNEYVTTLEKNYYGSEVAFNLSPVLSTLTTPGKVASFNLNINKLKNGAYSNIGSITDNYTTVGYMVNQGDKYINAGTFNFAQNFKRGEEREFANNSLLYVYAPSITLSFYNGTLGGFNITADYVDSAGNVLDTLSGLSWNNTDSEKKLWDYTINLAMNARWAGQFQKAFYIDVHYGTQDTVRYNVIKPIKATEYYQRIYWRNSYGGISFFDFTGQKSESREADIMTYQKNIFDYHTDTMNELEKIYNNEIKYTVTVKSHLFENDGKYIFNDLMQSPLVWTEVNGEKYAIIIDSVSVDETNNNSIFEATVKYHYSQEPSLI